MIVYINIKIKAFNVIQNEFPILFTVCLLIGPISSNLIMFWSDLKQKSHQVATIINNTASNFSDFDNSMLKVLETNADSILSILMCLIYIIFFGQLLKACYRILSQAVPEYIDIELVTRELKEMVSSFFKILIL